MIGYNESVKLRNDGLDDATGKVDLNAAIGVLVTVRVATVPPGTGATATLYDVNDIEIPNPVTTDQLGNYFFKVEEGTYDIIIKEGTGDEVIEPSQPIGGSSGGQLSFVTVAQLASGLVLVGDSVHVSDRANAIATVVAGGTADGRAILDASGGDTAVIDGVSHEVSTTEYSANDTDVGATTNYLIADFNQSGIAATGGVIDFPFGDISLDETILIHNPSHTFNLDSIKLKGKGRHSTIINASGVVGNALEMRLGLYNIIEGFTIEGAQGNGLFIDDGPLSDEPSSNSSLKDMVFKGCSGNGVYAGRSFVMSYYDLECLSNIEAGIYFDFRIHTSQLMINCYTRSNGGAGVRSEYLIYSAFIAHASDRNLYGYLVSGNRGVGYYASGAETNKRSGWQYNSDSSHEINWCSGTSLVAVDNNTDYQDNNLLVNWANHSDLIAMDGVTNFVCLRQPVSLTSANQDPATPDFRAQGRGSMLVLVDPYMENAGPKAEVDGFIQMVYQAPKLVYQLNFTGPQDDHSLIALKNQNGLTADWSGKLLITVSNAMFGSTGNIGTATYEVMVSKAGVIVEQQLISALGLVNGTDPTHPSFTFITTAGGIIATAVSLTEGDFWFAIEKIAGNLMWND